MIKTLGLTVNNTIYWIVFVRDYAVFSTDPDALKTGYHRPIGKNPRKVALPKDFGFFASRKAEKFLKKAIRKAVK